MRGFVAFGVRRPIVGSLLMWLLVIGGTACLISIRREFFPRTDPDAARVSLAYPGASPQEIEESMVRKIEDRIADLDGIKRLESNINEGGGTILVQFEDGHDVTKQIEDVRVAIDGLEDLPDEAERIRVTEVQPNIPVIMLTLAGDIGESSLKAAARRVETDLRTLPGMGSVITVGTRGAELSIDVDAHALERHGLGLATVADVVRSWMAEVPGGTMRTAAANLGVRTMGAAERAEAVRLIPLVATSDGQVVRIGDVATVTEGFRDEQVTRRFNGMPAVTLIVFKTSDEDAVRMAETVRGYIAGRNGDEYRTPSAWSQVKSMVQGSDRARGYALGAARRVGDPLPVKLVAHSDLARIIEGRLDLLTNDAIQGSALVLVVMLLFMNARSAWWVMSGIFVSIGCTVLLMWMLDVTLNLVTMFGLLIVVGMLADDAIVVSDIILQRAARGESAEDAAIEGTTSVFWPIVTNATTVIIAFVPLAFVSGRMGDLLGQLPLVAAVALGSSVVETMLILPAHMAHSVHAMHDARPGVFARLWKRFEDWRETRVVPAITRRYRRVVQWCLDQRYVTAGATAAVFLLSIGMVAGGRVPLTFLTAEDTENVIIDVRLPIGATLESTKAVAAKFERAAAEQPEIAAISTVIGQTTDFETGTPQGVATHLAQMFVELKPVESRSKHSKVVLDQLRESVGPLDETESVIYRELSGGPAGAAITYQLRGPDREEARVVAAKLKEVLRGFDGVFSIADDDYSTQRELHIELTQSAAAMGLAVADVARQVRGMLYGLEAHTYSENREDIKVRVRLDERARGRIDSLQDLRVATHDGRMIPLLEIARVSEENANSAVHRVDRERTITVSADCANHVNPEEITRAIAPELERLRHEHPTIDIRSAGRQKDLADAFSTLPLAFLAALCGIYVVLAWLFSSYVQPLAVMLAIPFGMIGVIWGHYLMGYQMTFLSMIGFVALAGIVVNNSLILVEFANQERRAGLNLVDSLVRAGAQRLRPIFLTTGTTVVGLVPLLSERSFQARFLIPMGISIGAGLVSATALTLLLLPSNIVIMDDIGRLLRRIWNGEIGMSEASTEATPDATGS